MGVVLAVVALLVTAVCVGLAISVSPRFFWPAAFFAWVVSFLWSWSIGLFTLMAAYVFLALAIGHSAGWIRKPHQDLLAMGVGVTVWAILISAVDDYWLFFPLNALLELFVG